MSASRNRGIDHALGEYISFLDADDLWTADKLEAQLNALRENPEAAVAYSWTDFIDERGNMLGIRIHYTVNGYVYPKLLEFFFIGSGSNALIRKQVFCVVGRIDETLTFAEDTDSYLRLASSVTGCSSCAGMPYSGRSLLSILLAHPFRLFKCYS